MNDPLRNHFRQLEEAPLRPEFEARLRRKLFQKRAASWGWVLAPALAAYVLIHVASAVPAKSPAPSSGLVAHRMPIMGGRS